MDEKGNPMFNLNTAEPLTAEDLAERESPPPDFTKIDEMFFGKKATTTTPLTNATNIVTSEDLAFERELQAMHKEVVLPGDIPAVRLEKEINDSNFLGDHMPDYKPAATLNELEQQVWAAEKMGANSIEATEDVIKYYNRRHYPDDTGYFIYKNIKVFIPGRIDGFIETDRDNVSARLAGLVK